jgi:sporulation protein YlmC with PRC-barrel domain
MLSTLVLMLVLAACDTTAPGPVVTEPGDEAVEPGAVEPGIVEPGTVEPAVTEPAVVAPGDATTADTAARGVGGAADLLVPASTLMGIELDGPEDEELGTIEDLMIDLNTGNVLFATVEHGGFLDIGDRDLPVPLNALQFSDDTDELRLPIPVETFENFPDIPDDWPADFAPGWEQEVGTFWTSSGFDTSILQGVDTGRVAWASDIMDYNLDAVDTPAFGDIQDLMVDLQNSSIRYIALTFSDTATYGADWRLIPFSALSMTNLEDASAITFNEDFDTNLLADAPAYRDDDLGDISMWNSTWDDEIESYWTNAGIAVTGAMNAAADALQEGADAIDEGTEELQEGAEEAVEAPETGAGQDATLLASALLGKELDNLNDEELGSIEDLLIDLNTGEVLFATIEHGGFLDIGDSDFPVPLTAMQWGAEEDEMIVAISPDMLETFPDIDDNWPGEFGEGWHTDLNAFWSNAGFDVSGIQNTQPGTIVRASELIGYGVGAADAQGLGNVEDMVIDLANSQVKYMVLSLADAETFGDEWVAVPYNAFNAGAFGDEFVFADDFDRNVLAQAPRIDEAGLYESPEFQTDWDTQIADFWNQQGYNFDGTWMR